MRSGAKDGLKLRRHQYRSPRRYIPRLVSSCCRLSMDAITDRRDRRWATYVGKSHFIQSASAKKINVNNKSKLEKISKTEIDSNILLRSSRDTFVRLVTVVKIVWNMRKMCDFYDRPIKLWLESCAGPTIRSSTNDVPASRQAGERVNTQTVAAQCLTTV